MPRTSRLSQRLAADGRARQEEATRLANRAANAVDRLVGSWWRLLVLHLADPRGNWYTVASLLRSLPRIAASATHEQLVRLARWARRSAVRQLVDVLPEAYLEKAANVLQPAGPPDLSEGLARHHRAGPLANDFPAAGQPLRGNRLAQLMEDRSDRQAIADLIFPAPPLERTEAAMARLLETLKFHGDKDRVPPERLAEVVARGMAQGKTQREIAKDLLPLANDVRASAMRVARTWGMYVAGQESQQVHNELGDLVIGYQVHASIDQNTRAWHAARDGQVYYLHPGPGQKGMEKCPHPPLEAADPTERPAKAPRIAWNCRCYLTPVLRPEREVRRG